MSRNGWSLTLGALAELESSFEAENLAGLLARFSSGNLAARDMLRKTAREAAKAEAFGREPRLPAESGLEERTEALWTAVRSLPDKQRDAVLLVYGEGLSHAAAADAMGCAEATVSWHVHEAKKRLKQTMRSAGEV